MTTLKFTPHLTFYDSNYMHKYMGLDDVVVRKWRDRGLFTGGEKEGRQYLYTIRDIATLMIMRELGRRGLPLSIAAEAAEQGVGDLVAQALYRETIMEVIAKPKDGVETIIKLIQTDNRFLDSIFPGSIGTIFTKPRNYLVSSDRWWNVIDDLNSFHPEECLAITHIDLRLLANRLIQVLYDFNDGTSVGAIPPSCQKWRPCVLTFETPGCWKEKPRIVWFSTNPSIEPEG